MVYPNTVNANEFGVSKMYPTGQRTCFEVLAFDQSKLIPRAPLGKCQVQPLKYLEPENAQSDTLTFQDNAHIHTSYCKNALTFLDL